METQNLPSLSDLQKLVRSNTRLLILCLIVVAVLICISIFSITSRTGDIVAYKKEIKQLAKELSVMKESFTADSIKAENLRTELIQLRIDRQSDRTDIFHLGSELKQYPRKYEKIRDYSHLTDDSLYRVFSDRYDY